MATILTKKSDTASSVPLAADLTNAAGGAELAVNTADKRVFSKTSGGTVVELGTNPSSMTLPNGTANGIPYLNGSKALTTGSALTFDGTNLGVGETSPQAYLHIRSTSGLTPQIKLGGNAAYQLQLGYNNSAEYGFLQAYAANLSTPDDIVINPSGGNLLVGTTSTLFNSKVTFKGAGNTLACWEQNGSSAAALICRIDNTGGRLTTYNYSGSDVGTVTTNGTSTSYNTSSDYRLKTDIQPMTGALAFVRKQRPVTYRWKADGSEGSGYIAHWLQEDGAGQCVTGKKDAADADGKAVYQGIDTSFMVGPLNAALNELADIVDAQAAIIDSLKARLDALEAK